jgi:putative flippase GtrA
MPVPGKTGVRQFALFCLSGAMAFAIDGGLTQFWVGRVGLDPWNARALAFPVALTFTWWFNRQITFRVGHTRSLWREWTVYAGTQLLGWALNLGTYALMVLASDFVARWPIIAVAAGSLVGLVANYLGAKHVAFKPRG